MTTPTRLTPVIADYLRQYSVRRRIIGVGSAMGQAILLLALWFIAWGLIDRFVAPIPSLGRIGLLAILVLVIGWILGRAVAEYFRRDIDWQQAADEIESRDSRFGETLLTIVSESLLAADRGASPTLLNRLAQRVVHEIDSNPRPISPPTQALRFATIAAGFGMAVFASLFFWPRLSFGDLVARQLFPLSSVAPVKTTHLRVEPGSVERHQGDSLTINAWAYPLQGSTVVLRTTTDGQNWTSIGMAPSRDGSFTHTFQAILRDLVYEVRAGDAVVGQNTVRVLRQPLVHEFRIHLDYPPYIRRAPLNIINSDGAIQAPVGTKATITLYASEHLKSATFTIDGKPIDGKPTGDPASWQVQIPIQQSSHWTLAMLSDRGVQGNAPADMTIRAIPDRPPIARLVLPDGALLMRPADSIRIGYEAADDYGIASLQARVSVNSAPPIPIDLAVGTDPLHCRDSFPLDLSQFKVAIGDVVSVALAVKDHADHTSVATPSQILIASQAITPEQRRLVANLGDASRLADLISADLDAAAPATERSSRGAGLIASASESAPLLLLSLLQAQTDVRDQPLAWTIGSLIDQAALQAALLDRMIQRGNAPDLADAQTRQISRAREAASELKTSSRRIWSGLSADLVLIEREGFNQARDQTQGGIVSLKEDIDANLHELGIDPALPDVQSNLQAQVNALHQLTDSAHPVDFLDAADRWAAAAGSQDQFLPERLTAAAQAESGLFNGDVDWNRDLLLAARAVRILDDAMNRKMTAIAGQSLGDARRRFAESMRILWQNHTAHERIAGGGPVPNTEAAVIGARQALEALIGEARHVASTRPSTQNSQAASGLAGAPTTQEGDSREQALLAIRQAQETLAKLPQELGRVEQSAQFSRQSLAVARQAARDAVSAAPDARPAADRAVDISQTQSDDSFAGLLEISQEIDLQKLNDMIESLLAFGADTAPAVSVIQQKLNSALAHLRENIDARNPDGIDAALIECRAALSASQDSLRQARQGVLEKDPLVAAGWFLEQTALLGPTSNPSTSQPQNQTLSALSRGRTDPLQRPKETQFTGNPSQSISSPNSVPPGLASHLARLRPWFNADLNNSALPSQEDDSPQFKDALRAYFKVLGQQGTQIEP